MKNGYREMFEVTPPTSNAEFLQNLTAKADDKRRRGFTKTAYSLAAAMAVITVGAAGIGLAYAKSPAPFSPDITEGTDITEAAQTSAEYAESETADPVYYPFDVWDYAENGYGASLAGLKKYAKPPRYAINTETFDDIDFEIKGVVGDGLTTMYVILEATAVNGFEFDMSKAYRSHCEPMDGAYFSDTGKLAIDGSGSSGIFKAEVVNPKKAVLVFGVETKGLIYADRDYDIVINGIEYDVINGIEYDGGGVIPGQFKFTVNANYDCEIFESPEPVNANVEMSIDADGLKSDTEYAKRGVYGVTVRNMRLTPLSLTYEFTCGEEALAEIASIEETVPYVYADLEDVRLEMKDGRSIVLTSGSYGPVEYGMQEWNGSYVYGVCGSKNCVPFNEVIDLSEVRAVVFGDYEYVLE